MLRVIVALSLLRIVTLIFIFREDVLDCFGV